MIKNIKKIQQDIKKKKATKATNGMQLIVNGLGLLKRGFGLVTSETVSYTHLTLPTIYSV